MKGDEIMDEIYRTYYPPVYRWFLKKTRHKEDAEDLTNNVFLAIFTYFKQDIKVNAMENLIWKIAHNIWCKKAKKYSDEHNNVSYDESLAIATDDESLDKIIYREIIDDLNEINLTERERTSFISYYCHDLSIKEISALLNTSTNNIKYYLFNARKKVKERYNG